MMHKRIVSRASVRGCYSHKSDIENSIRAVKINRKQLHSPSICALLLGGTSRRTGRKCSICHLPTKL